MVYMYMDIGDCAVLKFYSYFFYFLLVFYVKTTFHHFFVYIKQISVCVGLYTIFLVAGNKVRRPIQQNYTRAHVLLISSW